jgi:endonuclease III
MKIARPFTKKRASQIMNLLILMYEKPISELYANSDYEFLFAVIMSAQTTDLQVNKLTKILYNKYTSLSSFALAPEDELIKDMSKIGLYRTKAKNIQATAKILIEKWNGKVPNSLEEISKLPGAGKKTANVVTGDYFKNNQGIAVDTHVIRLANRLGLSKEKTPEKIEENLKKLFPKKEWANMSLRLILYGRYYFRANGETSKLEWQIKTKPPLWEFVLF